AIPLIHKTHMGNTLEVGIVNTENVAWSWVVNPPRRWQQSRRPRIPRLEVARLPMAPAYERRTPGVAFIQPAVAEVFPHPVAVVVARGFADTDFGKVNFL